MREKWDKNEALQWMFDCSKISIKNNIYHLEGTLNQNGLYISSFCVIRPYRGKKMSYAIWKDIRSKFKVDITLEAFPTLINYYKKMGFVDLGVCDEEGYHELILKYQNERNTDKVQ